MCACSLWRDVAVLCRYNLETDPFLFNTYKGVGPSVPPAAYAHFVATDTGNCNPRFMRMTMYQVGPRESTRALPAPLHACALAALFDRMALQCRGNSCSARIVDWHPNAPSRALRCSLVCRSGKCRPARICCPR